MTANRIQSSLESLNQPGPMNPLEQVDLIGKLADLKDSHYQNSLLLTAMIEMLIEKGVFSAQELAIKAQALDHSFTLHPADPTP